jgi:hypothetical protein
MFLHRVAAKPPRLGFRRSPAFREKYALQICRIPQNARLLHCFISLRAGRHGARLFQGRQSFGFKIALGPWVFVLSGHGAENSQLIPPCLFGARLWNQSGNEMATATIFPPRWSATRRNRGNEPKASPTAGNLGFARALLRGRKGRKVQCSDILPFSGPWQHLQPRLPWPNNPQLRDR